jgi:hypothetical protein
MAGPAEIEPRQKMTPRRWHPCDIGWSAIPARMEIYWGDLPMRLADRAFVPVIGCGHRGQGPNGGIAGYCEALAFSSAAP